MSEQFKDQGGAATMDPSPFLRWVTSKLMSRMSQPETLQKQRAKVEKERIKSGAGHCVEYFHQVADGYSHLAAQVLQRFCQRYDIELRCHLVRGPVGKNAPEPDLLLKLSRYDADIVAPEYGLSFPYDASGQNPPPDEGLVTQATAILAALSDEAFIEHAAAIGDALWRGDSAALNQYADTLGSASDAQVEQALEQGSARQQELSHYSGAMFYYGKEWYWGVDRLYHLENRLRELGADKTPAESLLVPRPDIEMGPLTGDGSLTLEIYPSLRSPYTSISFDKTVQLARATGVTLSVRPVLPMVMRGVPATRQKGMYIFTDTAREARTLGVPYGNFRDPIGEPARQAYSLYPWAKEQGKDIALISAFLRGAFAQGINTNTRRGLQKVVENAGLNWQEAEQHLGNPAWQGILETNRQAMYDSGLWGVPSFRLLDEQGQVLLALWGQDRLWLFAREIQRQLAARA